MQRRGHGRNTDVGDDHPIAAASISETYADTLIVGASGFYSFSVRGEYGTVNVTLESIGGTFVPSTVMVGIGIGTPSGTEVLRRRR